MTLTVNLWKRNSTPAREKMDRWDSFMKKFARFSYFILNIENFCSYAIIVDPEGEPVDLPFLRKKDKNLEGMFVVPKLRDSILGKKYQTFFVVPCKCYLHFKKTHKSGILTKNGYCNPIEQFDKMVRSQIISSFF